MQGQIQEFWKEVQMYKRGFRCIKGVRFGKFYLILLKYPNEKEIIWSQKGHSSKPPERPLDALLI